MQYLFEIEEGVEYAVEYDFHPGEQPSWDSPGDGPEAEPKNDVRIWLNGKPTQQVIKWDEFILSYCAEHQITPRSAESKILDELCQAGEQEYADRFEDRGADAYDYHNDR